VIEQARALVSLARRNGYRVDELIQIIQAVGLRCQARLEGSCCEELGFGGDKGHYGLA